MSTAVASKTDLPSVRRVESTALEGIWQDCRTAFAGNRAMQANIQQYIPQSPRERNADYQRRAKFTSYYNAYGRTVRSMAGLPFRRRPEYGKDIPKDVLNQTQNIDGDGTALDIYARRLFEDALKVGCAGTLIDAPSAPPVPKNRKLSKRDDKVLGLRPYWVHVHAEDVITWRYVKHRGRNVLGMLVLRETVEDYGANEFTYEPVTKYLVYRLVTTQDGQQDAVTLQRYVEVKQGNTMAVMAEGQIKIIANIDSIPYVPLVLGMQTSPLTSVTPLIDLLDANLQHFRVSSDRNWLMHLSCVPIPVKKGDGVVTTRTVTQDAQGNTIGVSNGEGSAQTRETYGANVMMKVGANGDFKFVEPTGTAFEPTGKELEQLERRMASLGLSFLESSKRSDDTFGGKQIDAAVQNATLAACADALDDHIERCLAIHSQMVKQAVRTAGGDWSGGTWATSREYEQTAIGANNLADYRGMEKDSQLSLRTLWKIMERRGELPGDFDADDEEKAIKDQQEHGTLTLMPGDVPPDAVTETPEEQAARLAAEAQGSTPKTKKRAKATAKKAAPKKTAKPLRDAA